MITTNQTKLIEKILNDKHIRKGVVTESLSWFFTIYFHSYIRYKTAPFQEEIISIAEDQDIKLAVIVAFRGSAKSTIITTASVLWSILGRPQKKFVIILSQTEQKARQHLQNIKRELENNSILRKDLGPFDEEKNQWGSTALIIKKFNAKIMIGSVEQSIRGLRFGENRPDLIILDDVEDTNSVRTQEGRNKTYDWLTGEVIPAGDKNTRIIAIGNLLHEDSLLKRLQGNIESGEIEGIYREYPIIDENNQPLWPGKYPASEDIEAEKKKVMSTVAWAREYLLKIIDNEDQPIKREWIQYYDLLPPDNYHTYYATGIDLAISQKDRADYTAMVSAKICGRGENLGIYILPNIVNKRLTTQEILEQAKAISSSLHRGKLFIEDNGFQISFVDHLKRQNYPAEGVRSINDKYARLASISFMVQSGKVFFPKTGAELLIKQLLGFGIEKHDDLVDAFSLLLGKIAEKDCHITSLSYMSVPVDDSDLNHLNSRARFVITEERRKIRERPRIDAI